MSKKLNIEELKYLIPDYITGDISESEKAMVETALKESAELCEFYNEMKETFTFVGSVKQEEPSPQYWGSILPRVHERIDADAEKKFSWDKIAAIWKVLVPIAAIVLIAVIYYLVQPSNTQLTKEDKKVIEEKKENINKDTNKQKQESNQPETNPGETKDNNVKQNENNLVKELPAPYYREKRAVHEPNPVNGNDENIVKEENTNDDDILLPVNGDVASLELEETSIFTSGAAGLDEETEDDLKKLDNKELDKLLLELENSNL